MPENENGKPNEDGKQTSPDHQIAGDAAAAAYQRQATGTQPAAPTASNGDEVRIESGEASGAEEDASAKKIAELTDLLQRSAAEFDNYRKRVLREREEITARAAAALMEEMLPVLDAFELALQADTGDESFVKGVEMISAQLRDLLTRHGLEPIPALGKQFDPNYHEALAREERTDVPDGRVIDELQRGYMLGGRVLRPARVRVAARPEKPSGGNNPDDGPIEIPIK